MDGIRGWLREFRAAAGGYEDQQLRQAFPGLSSGAVRAAALGALQTAAGALARALATAAVTGARGALTAETLYAIGYDLVRHGQYVALLQIQRDGAARLLRADANSPTYGGPDRESWRYTLTLGGPSHTRTLTAPADTVAHVIWNSASITPWRGRSPLAVASASSELAARINQSLSDESNIPVSRSIPMPYGTTPEDGNRWVGWFIEAAASHRRGMIFPESTRPARGQGVIAAPTTDWKGNRIGSDIPESSVQAARAVPAGSGRGVRHSARADAGRERGRAGDARGPSATTDRDRATTVRADCFRAVAGTRIRSGDHVRRAGRGRPYRPGAGARYSGQGKDSAGRCA